MSGIEILGTGSYVPEFVADNNKFAEFLDTSDEWITPRTGIKQRHILTDKPGYYMGIEAAKKALDDAGIPHIKLGVDQQMRDFGQASTAIQAFADVL